MARRCSLSTRKLTNLGELVADVARVLEELRFLALGERAKHLLNDVPGATQHTRQHDKSSGTQLLVFFFFFFFFFFL